MSTQVREQLDSAFKKLRALNMIALQNFKCCGNCAGYAITEKAEQRIAKGKTVDGAVYYHGQDASDLRRGENFEIRYGQMDSVNCGQIGKPTVEVGKIVSQVFTEVGLPHKWDGDPFSTITVLQKFAPYPNGYLDWTPPVVRE